MGGAISGPLKAVASTVAKKADGRPSTISGSLDNPVITPIGPDAVQSTEEARQRAARTRARRTGRPLLGPGGAQRNEELQTTLGVG